MATIASNTIFNDSDQIIKNIGLFDFDLCFMNISFPAKKIASIETVQQIINSQGITLEEKQKYILQCRKFLELLKLKNIQVIFITRNSEANVRFILKNIIGIVNIETIIDILSVHDLEEREGKKIQKWEVIDDYFHNKGWISSKANLDESNYTINRGIFIDDSPSEIKNMKSSPLSYVTCIQAWRPGKINGKHATYQMSKQHFGKVPGIFNHPDIVIELWKRLTNGSEFPDDFFNL